MSNVFTYRLVSNGSQQASDSSTFNSWTSDSGGSSTSDYGWGPLPSLSSTAPSFVFGPAFAHLGAGTTAASPSTAGDSYLDVANSGGTLTFSNTFDGTVTAAYKAAIVSAEDEITSLFSPKNSVTVAVSFTQSNQGNNGDALGNSFYYTSVGYSSLTGALPSSDVLPSSNPGGSQQWIVPDAYGRMLGITSAQPPSGKVDDAVSLNTFYGPTYGQDVVNGLIHELSEGSMGRIGDLGDSVNGTASWSTMDLFRYNGSGKLDVTNGSDGDTTYFSSNGGATLSNQNAPSKGAPTLTFNNQLNSGGSQNNTGDTADWTQQQVFGSTGSGETLTLDQTELSLMQALGWTITLQQDFFTTGGSQNWETPTGWTLGYNPIEPQDAAIGEYGNVANVTLTSNVIVNSISVSVPSTFTIAGGVELTAVFGTSLNSNDTGVTYSGIYGVLNIDPNGTLFVGPAQSIGTTIDNLNTMNVGLNQGSGGRGYLEFGSIDQLTLTGSGTVNLGSYSSGTFSTGQISGDILINTNNTIVGGGLISVSRLDNQASGKIVASQGGGNQLVLTVSGSFSNEGLLEAESGGTLAINSPVTTGGGTIEATSGGKVDIAAAVTGQSKVVVDTASSVVVQSGGSVQVPVNINGKSGSSAGGTLTLQSGGAITGTITFESAGGTFNDTSSSGSSFNISGGGGAIDFSSAGNTANISGTGGTWDSVTGSNDTVDLTGAQSGVTGGGDAIYFKAGTGNAVSLYGTGGNADTVYGSNGAVGLNGAQTNVVGGGDTIYFSNASGNAVVLYGTSFNFDNVYGSGGTVDLYGAQATVTGGSDTIYLLSGGTGNAASLYGTGGNADSVYGSSGTVYLTSAQASIIGGFDTIYFAGGSGNFAYLSGTAGNSDTVYGSNGTVYLTSAQVSVVGGSDAIYFYGGSGNSASLFGTTGNPDTVYGSNGTVYLTGAQVSVVGGGDTTYFSGGSGNSASLFSTGGVWDSVYGSNGTVDLTSAQASVWGGGDTTYFSAGSGNVASLYNTGGVWDSVYGSSGTVALTGAQATVSGNGNSVDFYGTNNWLSAIGGSEAFVFQPAIGLDTINGFGASDSMAFSASDFANFAALSPHISQSGSNTLISLDANDTVTLTNTTATSLTASQFHFV